MFKLFKKKIKEPVLPADDPTSIGNLLVDNGLDREVFAAALIIFKNKERDKLLGEFLVGKGVITKEGSAISMVVQTNEELLIAQDAAELAGK